MEKVVRVFKNFEEAEEADRLRERLIQRGSVPSTEAEWRRFRAVAASERKAVFYLTFPRYWAPFDRMALNAKKIQRKRHGSVTIEESWFRGFRKRADERK